VRAEPKTIGIVAKRITATLRRPMLFEWQSDLFTWIVSGQAYP